MHNAGVMSILKPERVIAELKELRGLTGDENGAQRVAFTPMWVKAREWYRGKLGEVWVVEAHFDVSTEKRKRTVVMMKNLGRLS